MYTARVHRASIYLRPWLKFAQAGGRGVMLSHNMALWEPMHGNRRLVTGELHTALLCGAE